MVLMKIVGATVVLLLMFVENSHPASLSAFEQKKYKNFIEGQGLYSSSDDVEILSVHNFKREVMGAPHAWLVEFYNSWCGFCQRFAPSWKALATDVKGWNHMVKIAAIDCSDDDNFPICREYEIMAYPTLRYFHENYQQGPKNLGVDVAKGEDVNAHRHNLVAAMVSEQTENRGMMYPNLRPFTASTLGSLFDDLPQTVQYVLLVIEEPNTYLAEEAALDLSKTTSIVLRVAHKNNTALISNAGVTTIPALVAVDRNNNIQTLQGFDSRESLDKTIKEFLHSKHIEVGDVGSENKDIFKGKWLDAEVPDMSALMQERARQALKERIKKMGDVVFQMDLETTLRYSLKHEISTLKSITGEKLVALRKYIEALSKYFPFGHGGHIFLNELKDAVDGDVQAVEGSNIANIVKNAEAEGSQVFSSPQQWLACKGSSPTYRGYPCGLWKTFHYLTVNAAEQNVNNRDANPREILEAMHGYIKNFFGCADCSQHFQQMAQRLDIHNVSSHDGSILWLWMAHNEVNKRLAGDQTEDPEYPKYQFPSQERCPSCRNSDGTWNFAEVLKYIKHMYSSINVHYIGSDTKILHLGLEGTTGRSESTTIFKALDMSMCFILYVSCFALLAVLIRMFLKRGYRKKPYMHDLLGKV